MTQNNQMQEVKQANPKLNRVADQFGNQVVQALDIEDNQEQANEARRLTMALVVSVNEALKGNWGKLNGNKFVTDALRVVSLGLDASNNEVYAVPYGGDLEIRAGAWGYRKIALQYSVKPLRELSCYPIKEGDVYNLRRTKNGDELELKQKPFNTGETLGYITVAIYEDDTVQVMEHTLEYLNKLKGASPAGNGKNSPWNAWTEEMHIAKCIKRHAKKIPYRLTNLHQQEAFRNLSDEESQLSTGKEQYANKEELDFEEIESNPVYEEIQDHDTHDYVPEERQEEFEEAELPEAMREAPNEPSSQMEFFDDASANAEMPYF